MEQSTISTSQSSILPTVSTTTLTSGVTEKRQKKPLLIVDPTTNKPVEVSTTTMTTPLVPHSKTNTESHPIDSITTTDSSTSNTGDTNKTQIQEVFRRQVAEKLGDSSNIQSDKVINNINSIYFIL